jgi:transcription elongation factor
MRKEKTGNFTCLDQILELDGFGIKVFEKFCDSIIQSKEESVAKTQPRKVISANSQQKKSQFVSPLLHESVRKSIKSCVSVQIGLDNISWTKFRIIHDEDDSKVKCLIMEDWNNFEMGEDKKLSLTDFIQILLLINKKIPDGDVYILEALPNIAQVKQPGSPVQVNINVQKSQLVAMLGILLANRKNNVDMDLSDDENEELKRKSFGQQKVFFLKNYLASKLFKVFIGNEKVSTESVVENILRYNYQEGDSLSGDTTINGVYVNNMDVSLELRQFYNDTNRITKEYLGQSLLLGLTFIKLCVIKNPESIGIVSRN